MTFIGALSPGWLLGQACLRTGLVGLLTASICTSLIAGPRSVKRLEWIDPLNRTPTSYDEWLRRGDRQKHETEIGRIQLSEVRIQGDVVDLVINSAVYPEITSEIDRFTQDLIVDGYTVVIDTISGMSEQGLRSHLAGVSGLVGAILIGEAPVAWFETDGFGEWEEFPCDLYFSDLDGVFLDSDGDGLYDGHMGDVAPEIWVGRLYARNLTWDHEINLLKTYFTKNHLYRTDSLFVPTRGLSFVDDDWSYWTTCDLDLVYETVVVVNDDYQTTASNYRSRLDDGFEWIHLCAHSSPWGHTFKYPSDQYRGTVFNYEIFTLQPAGIFYNLFACSGTRFTEENSSAGWYLFAEDYGLLVVGSSKTGSMLYFDDFYGPLSQGMSVGDAFREWFTAWGESDWDWFYGMNLLGDPTLKPGMGGTATRVIEDEPSRSASVEWGNPELVASDPESDAFPRITSGSGENLWVVWESGRSQINGRSEIYGAYRDADTWSPAMAIGPTLYWDYCPDVGIDAVGRPVAVWAGWIDIDGNYQYDILSSVYDDGWSNRAPVHALHPGFDLKPTTARDNLGRLWVAWESRRDASLDICASYFDGSVWYAPPWLVTQTSSEETCPSMVIDSIGRPWVFYARRSALSSEIYGCYFDESEWIESGPISANQTLAHRPQAAVDGTGRIWVAWYALDGGNPDIFVSRFDGGTWCPPAAITQSLDCDLWPSLTSDLGGSIWLVYQSREDGEWDIYFSRCIDSTWTTPELVADVIGADIAPEIACSDSNRLWVAWQSYSAGNWEIMATSSRNFVEASFIRADVDGDSAAEMSDAVAIMRHIYVPDSEVPTCLDACDVNDDGEVKMSDAIHTLRYLYVPGSPSPSFPFPDCGEDLTADFLECQDHPCMERGD